MIHRRKKRIDTVDDIRFFKTIVVDVGLDRMKEWTLSVEDFGISAGGNKLNIVFQDIKNQIREIHRKYLEGTLEEPLSNVYSKYLKDYQGRSSIPQAENVKKVRQKNRESKKTLEVLSISKSKLGHTIVTTVSGVYTFREGVWFKKYNKVTNQVLLEALNKVWGKSLETV
jgi:IMP dehydrogenase/GMP reductase